MRKYCHNLHSVHCKIVHFFVTNTFHLFVLKAATHFLPTQTDENCYLIFSIFFCKSVNLVQIELPPNSSSLSFPQFLRPIGVSLRIRRFDQKLVEGVRASTFVVFAAFSNTRRPVQRVRLFSLFSGRSGFLRRSCEDDRGITWLRSLSVSLSADLFDHQRNGNEGGLRRHVPVSGVAVLLVVVIFVELKMSNKF